MSETTTERQTLQAGKLADKFERKSPDCNPLDFNFWDAVKEIIQ